ncbi:HAD family phosphatase [bacterium]|jgi:beta-phosphoglucomutase family hydrolase|nr:HAD family phosphatase [bacterium]
MKGSWAAVFDWDGVVLDSSRHHEESWERLAREIGKPLPSGHFRRGFGRRNIEIMRDMLKWSRDLDEIDRLSRRKEELYREVVGEWGIEPLPGVRPWLERLADVGIPCGIGSSTEAKNVQLGLEKLGLTRFFQTAVTAEHVQKGKPAPDVFLEVARRLGMEASRCVVFEDAPAGVEAGRAAGMKVVGVTTTHPGAHFEGVFREVERLDELTTEELAGWFSAVA